MGKVRSAQTRQSEKRSADEAYNKWLVGDEDAVFEYLTKDRLTIKDLKRKGYGMDGIEEHNEGSGIWPAFDNCMAALEEVQGEPAAPEEEQDWIELEQELNEPKWRPASDSCASALEKAQGQPAAPEEGEEKWIDIGCLTSDSCASALEEAEQQQDVTERTGGRSKTHTKKNKERSKSPPWPEMETFLSAELLPCMPELSVKMRRVTAPPPTAGTAASGKRQLSQFEQLIAAGVADEWVPDGADGFYSVRTFTDGGSQILWHGRRQYQFSQDLLNEAAALSQEIFVEANKVLTVLQQQDSAPSVVLDAVSKALYSHSRILYCHFGSGLPKPTLMTEPIKRVGKTATCVIDNLTEPLRTCYRETIVKLGLQFRKMPPIRKRDVVMRALLMEQKIVTEALSMHFKRKRGDDMSKIYKLKNQSRTHVSKLIPLRNLRTSRIPLDVVLSDATSDLE